MTIPFSQTTRTLQADQSRFSLLALVFLIIMLSAWCLWFFTASVHNYVSSTDIKSAKDSQPIWQIPAGEQRPSPFIQYRIEAKFKQNLDKILPGQSVRITRKSTSLIPAQALKSTVVEVDRTNGLVTSDLLFRDDGTGGIDPFRDTRPIRMDVSVEQETPATFLFHMLTAKKQSATKQGNAE